MSEINQLESTDKNIRERAAFVLGNEKTKASLRALFKTAQHDDEKDVRKAAIDSIIKLNDPEAIPVLEEIQSNDKDRGVRNKAKDAVKNIRETGSSLPETSFSEADAERSRENFRALEEHEVKQAGLNVRLEENLKYRINRENNLVDENDSLIESLKCDGKIEVTNTGNNDRIWAIEAFLEGVDEVNFDRSEDQETAVFGNSFGIKELNPQGKQAVTFDFQIEAPKLKITEDFWDLVKTDAPPIFSQGAETGMRYTLEVTNGFDWSIRDVILKKQIVDLSTIVDNFFFELTIYI